MKKAKTKSNTRVKLQVDDQSCQVLVAGGAGFIGSHLCQVLLDRGCQVICLDNWATGKKSNLKDLIKQTGFTFIEQDINKSLPASLPNFDYIFHLAGLEAYLNNQELNLETLLVNSQGTKNLLNLAVKHKSKFLLVSSAQIFSGSVSKQSLETYFGEQKTATAIFSHHEAKRFAEALTTLFFKSKNVDARIVRLADVYGPRMELDAGNYLAKMFKSCQTDSALAVPGEGLQLVYPTYVLDVVNGLVKAMFEQGTEGQIFNLVNPEGISWLNLAYNLRQLSLEALEIEFVASEKVEPPTQLDKEVFQTQKELGWKPKTSLSVGLSQTLSWLKGESVNLKPVKVEALTNQPVDSGQLDPGLKDLKRFKTKGWVKKFFKRFWSKRPQFKFKPPQLKLKLSSRLSWLIIVVLVLVVSLSSPLVLLGFYSYRGWRELNSLKLAYQAGEFDQIVANSQSAQLALSRANRLVKASGWLTQSLGLSTGVRQLENLLTLAEDVAGLSEQAIKTFNRASILLEQSLQARPADYAGMLTDLSVEVQALSQRLDFLQALVDASPGLAKIDLFDIDQEIDSLTIFLPEARRLVSQTSFLLKAAPKILAFEDKRTYLVVFQNNAELRPTGGFIGSFAFLTFEKGKLLDFQVEDVYTADGQLKGHVEPPAILKQYLGEAGWYLRDANWNPDFPIAAKQIEWFLNKELNRRVDGVIGLNLNAAQLLLEAVGSVELVDYNEEITAANLFEKAEYHAEIDFFPGSTQKKDFLGSLGNQLFETVVNSGSQTWLRVLRGFYSALDQKEVLVNLHQARAQQVIESLGWSGSLRQIQTNTQVLANYLFVAEANLGVNKANYFLKRQLKHQTLFLKSGDSEQILTVDYDNQSPSQSWPAGDYKSYVRFYLPQDLEFEHLKLVNPITEITKTVEVDQSVESGKKVVGFFLTVPVGEQRQLVLKTRDPRKLFDSQQALNYTFYWQKQSGIKADPIEIKIDYPTFIRPTKLTPKPIDTDGNPTLSASQVIFQTQLDTDKVFSIDFRR